MTGTFNSLASALSEREISEISVARFSLVPGDLHELQIVDDDEIEAALALQAPRARADFGGRERRRFVDEDVGAAQLSHRRIDARPVVFLQPAGAQMRSD